MGNCNCLKAIRRGKKVPKSSDISNVSSLKNQGNRNQITNKKTDESSANRTIVGSDMKNKNVRIPDINSEEKTINTNGLETRGVDDKIVSPKHVLILRNDEDDGGNKKGLISDGKLDIPKKIEPELKVKKDGAQELPPAQTPTKSRLRETDSSDQKPSFRNIETVPLEQSSDDFKKNKYQLITPTNAKSLYKKKEASPDDFQKTVKNPKEFSEEYDFNCETQKKNNDKTSSFSPSGKSPSNKRIETAETASKLKENPSPLVKKGNVRPFLDDSDSGEKEAEVNGIDDKKTEGNSNIYVSQRYRSQTANKAGGGYINAAVKNAKRNFSLTLENEDAKRMSIKSRVNLLFACDKVNAHLKTIPTHTTISCQELVSSLIKITDDLLEQIVLIYKWIANNISYNARVYTHNDRGDNTPSGVLYTRTAVCEGYSRLFKEMLSIIKVQCEYVGGNSRDSESLFGEEYEEYIKSDPGHAWNRFFYDDLWHLADVTWGAGTLNKKKEFKKNPNSFYLCTPPEIFIRSHFPEQVEFQQLRESQRWSISKFSRAINFSKEYYESGLELKDFEEGFASSNQSKMKFTFANKRQGANWVFYIEVLFGKKQKISHSSYFYKNNRTNEWVVEVNFPQAGLYEVQLYFRDANEEKDDFSDVSDNDDEKKTEFYKFLFKILVKNTDKEEQTNFGYPYTNHFLKKFQPFSEAELAHNHKLILSDGIFKIPFKSKENCEFFIIIKNLILNEGESYEKYYKQKRTSMDTIEISCSFFKKGGYDVEVYLVNDNEDIKRSSKNTRGTLILKYSINYLNLSNSPNFGFQNSKILDETGYECVKNNYYSFRTDQKTVSFLLKPFEFKNNKTSSTYKLWEKSSIFLKYYKLNGNTLHEMSESLHKIDSFKDKSIEITFDFPEAGSYQLEAFAKEYSQNIMSNTGYKFLEYSIECTNYEKRSQYGYQSLSYLYLVGLDIVKNNVFFKTTAEENFEIQFSLSKDKASTLRIDDIVKADHPLYCNFASPQSYYLEIKDLENKGGKKNLKHPRNLAKVMLDSQGKGRIACDFPRSSLYEISAYFMGKTVSGESESSIYKFLNYKIQATNNKQRKQYGFQQQSSLNEFDFDIVEGDFYYRKSDSGQFSAVLQCQKKLVELNGKQYDPFNINSYFFQIKEKGTKKTIDSNHLAKIFVVGNKIIFKFDLIKPAEYKAKVFFRAIGENNTFESTGKNILAYLINFEGYLERKEHGFQNMPYLNSIGLEVLEGDFFFKKINRPEMTVALRNKPDFKVVHEKNDKNETFNTKDIESYWIKITNKANGQEQNAKALTSKSFNDRNHLLLTLRFPIEAEYEINVYIRPFHNGVRGNSIYPILKYHVDYSKDV